jgi:hypothetical protein
MVALAYFFWFQGYDRGLRGPDRKSASSTGC